MFIKKFNKLTLWTVLLLALPLQVGAISSTHYTIDPSSDTTSIHHSTTSSSFRLDGAIEPITGLTTTTHYKVESGSLFPGYCGDGFVDPTEDCEGSNLNSQTCITRGFTGGVLSCNTNCTFNTSGCSAGGGGGGGGGVMDPALFDPSFVDNSYTYLSSKLFFGTKPVSAIYVYVNNTYQGVTYPTDSRWQKMLSLNSGVNKIVIKAVSNYGTSAEKTLTITRRAMADINQDGKVDDYDLSLLVNHWMQSWKDGDFNENGQVEDYDLSLLVSYWNM